MKTKFLKNIIHGIIAWALIGWSGSPVGAAIKYVTPTGASPYDGNDWSSAYSSIQDAINACLTEASTIYLRYGTYTNDVQINVTNAVNLTLRGGYQGVGLTLASDPTILTRGAASARILECTNSLITLDSLTITNGGTTMNGAGLRAQRCSITLTNCLFTQNRFGGSTYYGAAIFASTGALTVVNSRFEKNGDTDAWIEYGGVIFANATTVTLNRVVFSQNRMGANNACMGGVLYLQGAGSLSADQCYFLTNGIRADSGSDTHNGGVIYATGLAGIAISNSTFAGNYCLGGSKLNGGVFYLTGATPLRFVGCTISGNAVTNSVEDFYLNISQPILIQDSTIAGGSGHGIYSIGTGTLTLANSIIHSQPQHGLFTTNVQPIVIQNSTIADNALWGVTNRAGTVWITNSIIWGNGQGGVGNTPTVGHSCLQDTVAGTAVISTDPRFVAGFYLSAAGSPFQTANSPCIDAGGETAEISGLAARTTRTDGTPDSGTVDLGYHPPATAVSGISNLVLYVDAVNGDNGNLGWSPGIGGALKTVSAALAKAIDGSTLNVSTGNYTASIGESLPLTVNGYRLSLIGTNAVTTFLNGAAASRVFQASGRGKLRLEGLTFTNGLANFGAGLALIGCQTTITNCQIARNRGGPDGVTHYGYGLYVSKGMLTLLDSLLANNINYDNYIQYGAGLCAENAALDIRKTTFLGNKTSGNNGSQGGGVYLSGGSALFDSCNWLTNFTTYGIINLPYNGGAIYATGVNPLRLTNCYFAGNYSVRSSDKGGGGVLYLGGGGQVEISDSVFRGNYEATSSEDIHINHSGSVRLSHCVMSGGSEEGIYKIGAGSLQITNCLIYGMPSHGVRCTNGTVVIANSTLADSVGGWGAYNANAGASLSLIDSIIWGNALGGIGAAAGASVSVNYTDSQEVQSGTANKNANPSFESGSYYLQSGSPAIDAGSTLATALGLNGRTTRLDGQNDSGTVDLGYHYLGATEEDVRNLTLYVDANNGDDGRDGWAWETSLKTISAALAKAINGTTIHIASGTYFASETYPLVLQDSGLSLKGTNRATTIINAGGAAGVLSATTKGNVWLEGLTFTNGYAAQGGGLFLSGCNSTITNCLITRNQPSGAGSGIGIYAYNGALSIFNSEITAQYDSNANDQYGGGLYASGVALALDAVRFANNQISGNWASPGAAIYLTGGNATLSRCMFQTNYGNNAYGYNLGGAIYATGVNPLLVTNCGFVGNYVAPFNNGGGNVLYLAGAGLRSRIVHCQIATNWAAGSTDDIHIEAGSAAFEYTVIGAGTNRGIYVAGGTVGLTNCLIYGKPSHGIQIGGGTLRVASSTLVGNRGWGITNGAGTVSVINSIVWGNSLGGISGTTDTTYTDSQNPVAGTGNLSADPEFTDPAAGDFRPIPGGPCANIGLVESWMLTALDLDGRARKIGGGVDLGCYESLSLPGTIFILK